MKKINAFYLAVGAAFVVSGCGGGIPSCDDKEVKKIVENIIINKKYSALTSNTICHQKDILGSYFTKPKDGVPEEEKCGVGSSYIKNLDFDLTNYLVESEQFATDNKSVYCEVSVDVNMNSGNPDFNYKRRHSLKIKMYEKTEDGSRRYEYNLD